MPACRPKLYGNSSGSHESESAGGAPPQRLDEAGHSAASCDSSSVVQAVDPREQGGESTREDAQQIDAVACDSSGDHVEQRSETQRKRAQRKKKKAAMRQQQLETCGDDETTNLDAPTAPEAAEHASTQQQHQRRQQPRQAQQPATSDAVEATNPDGIASREEAASAAAELQAAVQELEARAFSAREIQPDAQRDRNRAVASPPGLPNSARAQQVPAAQANTGLTEAEWRRVFLPHFDDALLRWLRAARAKYKVGTAALEQMAEGVDLAMHPHPSNALLDLDPSRHLPTNVCVTLFPFLEPAATDEDEDACVLEVGARIDVCPPPPPLAEDMWLAMKRCAVGMESGELLGTLFTCGGAATLAELARDVAERVAALGGVEEAADASPAGFLQRLPYVARKALDRVSEAAERPGKPLVGTPKPPDLDRIDWLQELFVLSSGVFLVAGKGRGGQLGDSTVAEFYGTQRSILGHYVSLASHEQAVLEAVLDACPSVFKEDAKGSVVPFARELCAYLAHCRAEGGLTLAVRLEGSPFKSFYRVLNAQIMAAEQEAARDMRERSDFDEPDERDFEDKSPEGSDAGPGAYLSDSDDEEEGHMGAASRLRFAMGSW